MLFFGLRSVIGIVSSWITTPFFSLRHYIDTSSATVPAFIRDREEMLAHIRSLEAELLSREGIHNTLEGVIGENETLRALLSASSSPLIGAGIIARPPQTPYDVVLVDRGSDDGVKEDTPVYYGDGKVLGYVHKAYTSYSLVTLISAPHVETTVYVLGPDIFARAEGQGGGSIRVYVPQGIHLGEGDLVVAPSIERGIIGDIEFVESNPTEPEQYGLLTFEVPLQSIRLVGIGTRPITHISFDDAQVAVENLKNEFLTFSIPKEISNSEEETSTSSEPQVE